MVLPDIPSVAQTPIELIELSLVSCQPVTVMIDGQPDLWDVQLDLSDDPTPLIGSLQANRDHPNGGTFGAQFPVQVKFTFTQIAPPNNTVILDTGLAKLPPFVLSTVGEAPWVSDVTVAGTTFVCGTGFAPGIEEDPMTNLQCCTKVGHAGPGHIHETGPPDCSQCPGACCDAALFEDGFESEDTCGWSSSIGGGYP
jgi:hypothetical protein